MFKCDIKKEDVLNLNYGKFYAFKTYNAALDVITYQTCHVKEIDIKKHSLTVHARKFLALSKAPQTKLFFNILLNTKFLV